MNAHVAKMLIGGVGLVLIGFLFGHAQGMLTAQSLDESLLIKLALDALRKRMDMYHARLLSPHPIDSPLDRERMSSKIDELEYLCVQIEKRK